MKVLCICQAGSCRSVALARYLKEWCKTDALVVSWEWNSQETIGMLCTWADRVVVMENAFQRHVPAGFREKTRTCEVGPDRFGSPFNKELWDLCKAFVDRGGLD
jgi:predicted protein tyrosine phosphatase